MKESTFYARDGRVAALCQGQNFFLPRIDANSGWEHSAISLQPMEQQLANSNWQMAKETAAGVFAHARSIQSVSTLSKAILFGRRSQCFQAGIPKAVERIGGTGQSCENLALGRIIRL